MKTAFLIAAIDSIGSVILPIRADWIIKEHAYEALDEAQPDFGYCKVIRSMPAVEYINLCENNHKLNYS